MLTQEQHPIEDLFNEQKKLCYPNEVERVKRMIAGTAFFPGGSGLWLGCSCSWYTPSDRPDMPEGKVMILGNYFDTKTGYEESFENKGENLKCPTWQNLLEYLHCVSIPLKHCFFTNAYMGLSIIGKSNRGPSPGLNDSRFVQGCESFFLEQITVQKPRLILALGEHSIDFIAGLSCDLTEWKKCKNFKELDDSDLGPVVKRVSFNSSQPATVVALVHPSGRKMFDRKNVKGRCYRGAKGEKAELKMLKSALKKSGLKK